MWGSAMSWSSGGLRRFNDLLSTPDEVIRRKERFLKGFPEEAPKIIEFFEKIISKGSEKIPYVARNKEGTDIFWINDIFWISEKINVGEGQFRINIVFKEIQLRTTWIGFSCEHRIINRPSASDSAKVLEDILDSLRQKY